MSIDIRTHFETRTPEGWAPLWPPVPDPEQWPDLLADHLTEDGSTLPAGAVAEVADHEAIAAYLRGLGPEEAMRRHGDRHILWTWPLPQDLLDLAYCAKRDGAPLPLLRQRDSAWFAVLSRVHEGEENGEIADAGEAGSRDAPDPIRDVRGLPPDLSPLVAIEAEDEADGIDHSWLLVSELLAQPELAGVDQVRWLRRHIPDPANTRMIFWFC
jgi:hypothetical protein